MQAEVSAREECCRLELASDGVPVVSYKREEQDDVIAAVKDAVEWILQTLEEEDSQREAVHSIVESLLQDVLNKEEELSLKVYRHGSVLCSKVEDFQQRSSDIFTSGAYSDPWTEYEERVWKRIMEPSPWSKFRTWVGTFFSYCCCCCPKEDAT